MSDLETYRSNALTWLKSVAPKYGVAARKGLTEAQDLALGRQYQSAKFDAGYAGINWPKDFGGQGLSHIEKVAFESEEMKFGMPNGYFGISLGMPVPILMRYGSDAAFTKERVLKALKGLSFPLQRHYLSPQRSVALGIQGEMLRIVRHPMIPPLAG